MSLIVSLCVLIFLAMSNGIIAVQMPGLSLKKIIILIAICVSYTFLVAHILNLASFPAGI